MQIDFLYSSDENSTAIVRWTGLNLIDISEWRASQTTVNTTFFVAQPQRWIMYELKTFPSIIPQSQKRFIYAILGALISV